MEMWLTIIAVLIIAFAIFYWGVKKKYEAEHAGADALLMLQQQNDALRAELKVSLNATTSLVNEQLARVNAQMTEQLSGVTNQLQTSAGQINQRMDNAARVVGEVKEGLGSLKQATERVFDVGKDIAGLQEILRAPKLRGGLGEFFLGDLLSQILPTSSYELQYGFKNGTRVDAVIKVSNGLVPVDSKFPMENFKRLIESETDEERKANKRKFVADVKKHIDDLSSRYILPDEGTLNFALMYIPAENVYYETIIKDEVLGDDKVIASYAFGKRVIPVSPNSFYAYLQTILLGLRGLEISRQAQSILSHLTQLSGDFDRFAGDFDVLGKHIGNTRNKYEESQKRLDRFGERLKGLGESGETVEPGEPALGLKEVGGKGAAG